MTKSCLLREQDELGNMYSHAVHVSPVAQKTCHCSGANRLCSLCSLRDLLKAPRLVMSTAHEQAERVQRGMRGGEGRYGSRMGLLP